jgi:hypothetical protein
MIWHGYTERHAIDEPNRRRDGAARRLGQTPEAVLHSPREVADWIVRRAAELAKSADDDGRRRNALLVRHSPAYRSAAQRGVSAYTTVHVSRTAVIDVCAEIARGSDDSCPAGAGGHHFVQNSKGDWRCSRCGARM